VAIAVTGIGVVSPIGVGEQAFFAALQAESSGVARDGEGHLLARVGEFGAKQHIAPASLRRLPRLSQMAIVAGRQALGDAAGAFDATRIGVVLGTGLGTLHETIGFLRSYLDGGPEAASPLLFPSSVMNAAAGQLALECQLRGINSTVNHKDASALGAVAMACDQLELGRADALLVGGVDELSVAALTGYRAFDGLSASAMRPYSRARDGFAPGEGAAIVLLEREQDARRRGARIRGLIIGRGESGDDRPRIGWGHAQSWPEASRAVAQAAASIPGRAIDWVAGGGNGGTLDERELAAIEQALGALPPTSSILAQTGEQLSSAMLRLVAALFALEQQVLPGTVGLSEPLTDFTGALVAHPRRATVEHVLVPSFAQGGANCALVVARA
jgi:3-oxoacyl-[acyl-carrier-protein] synthase II